jgi:aryl-alcohol dehydrogenase-like predicted oxidoreductase
MEYRQLGASGLMVPALSFGAATFAGENGLGFGATHGEAAGRIVDLCLEAGVTMFDTADIYSRGASETILGEALKGRRNKVLISTKGTFRTGRDANAVGSSRYHLIETVEAQLKRLGTDHIDVYQLHGFDAKTPVEETLSTLGDLVSAGKIRYVGVSNFSAWHLMKSLAVAREYGYPRYVVNQTYYSLIGRDYEWELMPLGLDQGVGAAIWSPLGWGRLTGKLRRGQPAPEVSRLPTTAAFGPPVDDEHLYRVVDALEEIAAETGKSIPQIALNWLLQRPTVSTIIVGARDEAQLKENLGAVGWSLTADQMGRLNAASDRTLAYPYWHQRQFVERNPAPV